MTIREYIQQSIPQGTSLPIDDSFKGKVNARIIKELEAWKEPITIVCSDLLSLIKFEVDAYKRTATGNDEPARGIMHIRDTDQNIGRVLSNNKVVTYYTTSSLTVGDEVPYTYDKNSKRYTIPEYSKGDIKPYPGKARDSEEVSEQFCKSMYPQMPSIKSTKNLILSSSNKNVLKTGDNRNLFIRRTLTTYGVIKDGSYKEYEYNFKEKTEQLKTTIDLSSHLSLNAGEKLTIGKFLEWSGCVVVLVLKHTKYATRYAADDPYKGMMYNRHNGGATIRGEIIIIDVLKGTSSKIVTANAHSASNQLYFSGAIDMLIDLTTSNLVIAKLSETPTYSTLSYSGAKITCTPEDRLPHDPPYTETVEFTTHAGLDAFINAEYTRGNGKLPYFLRVVKTGGGSWTLETPTLDISTYKLTRSTLALTHVKNLYKEENSGLNSKYGYSVSGGYTNCMLYQNPYEDGKPIYLGRGYAVWIQLPAPTMYKVVPIVLTKYKKYMMESSTYTGGPIPGEIVGMFGTRYYKLAEGSLSLIADIPGGSGASRCNLTGEPTGDPSGYHWYETSTHNALFCLNNYNSSIDIAKVKANSLFHTFSGGTGSAGMDAPVGYSGGTRPTVMGFSWIFAARLNIQNVRFAVVEDASDNTKKKLVLTGAKENMAATAYDRPYRAHDPYFARTADSGSGLFVVDFPATLPSAPDYIHTVALGAQDWQYSSNSTEPYNPPNAYTSIGEKFETFTLHADILMVDKSTYYTAFSCLRHFYCNYWNNATGMEYWDGLLWWYNDRQMWKLDGTLKGWVADLEAHQDAYIMGYTEGPDSPGVLKLQIY